MKLLKAYTLALAGMVCAAPAQVKTRDTAKEGDGKPGITDAKFIGYVMDAHWYWRKMHCAQDLTWDPALAQAALQSVNKCTDMPEHDRGGSNLSAVGPAADNEDKWYNDSAEMVHGWHQEEVLYPYDHPYYDDAWGHFSQMVWRDTSRVGCAWGYCPGKKFPGRLYCFYDPPGNNIAENNILFPENVWKPVCQIPNHK
ncbi:PR-1-like protein [Polyplosphaeria fusca]|uniref:PR-1-like protein n=1 Tax=Polyplosphaeria fusca TaxID=682080 RepID=A0A9P4QZG3_9PLEO|nr:PR-1-like protein [Polyplosphaeria fusca]